MVLLCNFFLIFAHPKVLQHLQESNANSSEGAPSDSCEGPILIDKNPTPSVAACNLEQPSTSDSWEGPILVDINPAPTKGACNYEQPPTSDSCEGPTLVDYPSEEKTKINVGTHPCEITLRIPRNS